MAGKIKVVGKRTFNPKPSSGEHDALLKTIGAIRNHKGICQRGVFRFKSFATAQSWMIQNLAAASAGNPR